MAEERCESGKVVVTCEFCGLRFHSAWADKDAAEEFQENFPGEVMSDTRACDECYDKILEWQRTGDESIRATLLKQREERLRNG